MTTLPPLLAEIAEVAGEEAALALAQARGGTRVYIPPVIDPDHWISKLIGHQAALRVCDRLTAGLAGRRVDLPLGPTGTNATMRAQQAHADRMIIAGRSERDIARETGYTTRQVRRRRAAIRDDRQMNLL
ncbi:MAG: hypothetical protein IE932_10900 [Sphingopyxis terrae]|nr:hypothetical protein [Sphingopyxis terrae]